MTNKELAAKCLIEASELLNEAAARNQRKEIVGNLKSMKKEEKIEAFLKGKLPADEAKEIYTEIKKELESIEREIEKIPPETTGEKLAAYFIKSQFTVTGFTKYFVVGTLVGIGTSALGDVAAFCGLIKSFKDLLILNGMKNVAANAATIATFRSLSKTKSGERNWNKAYAEDILYRVQKKLNNAYVKHYAKHIKSTNEAVELLIETASFIDD